MAWKGRMHDTIGLGIEEPVEDRLAISRLISWKGVGILLDENLKILKVKEIE